VRNFKKTARKRRRRRRLLPGRTTIPGSPGRPLSEGVSGWTGEEVLQEGQEEKDLTGASALKRKKALIIVNGARGTEKQDAWEKKGGERNRGKEKICLARIPKKEKKGGTSSTLNPYLTALF